jgi:hypothetical protein
VLEGFGGEKKVFFNLYALNALRACLELAPIANQGFMTNPLQTCSKSLILAEVDVNPNGQKNDRTSIF